MCNKSKKKERKKWELKNYLHKLLCGKCLSMWQKCPPNWTESITPIMCHCSTNKEAKLHACSDCDKTNKLDQNCIKETGCTIVPKIDRTHCIKTSYPVTDISFRNVSF